MTSYEMRATMPGNGHVYVVGWEPTLERARAILELAVADGTWIQPTQIIEIEIPDMLPEGRVARTME